MVSNVIKQLRELRAIDQLIRDPKFRATQGSIGLALGITDRTVRTRMNLLKELGAPLSWYGGGIEEGGWIYGKDWDLRMAIWKTLEQEKRDRG